LFIENHRERDGVGAQLHRGRAQRIGGLQRMTALHAPMTHATLTDRHPEVAHDRALHREVLMKLRRGARPAHRSRTVRTLRRQRRVVRLVDVDRTPALPAGPIRRAWLAPGSARGRLGRSSRERRRLAIHGPARSLKLVFQLVVFAPQSLAFGFGAAQVLAQPVDLPRLIVDDLLRVTRRLVTGAQRHASVMPDRRSKYK
jgi:hypothetical protein